VLRVSNTYKRVWRPFQLLLPLLSQRSLSLHYKTLRFRRSLPLPGMVQSLVTAGSCGSPLLLCLVDTPLDSPPCGESRSVTFNSSAQFTRCHWRSVLDLTALWPNHVRPMANCEYTYHLNFDDNVVVLIFLAERMWFSLTSLLTTSLASWLKDW